MISLRWVVIYTITILLQYYCMYCFSAVVLFVVFYTTPVSELRSLFIFHFVGVFLNTTMTFCIAPWVRRCSVQRIICKSSLSSRAACRTANDRPWIATSLIIILYIIFYNNMILIIIAQLTSYEKYKLRSVLYTRWSQNKTSSEVLLFDSCKIL